MPFKSEAQRRYFHWAAGQGKISPKTVKEWESHTPKGEKLPERVKKASFLDELEKIGKEDSRSLFKDFLAGVDPTGGKTFQYSISDAPKSKSEQNLRRAVGTVGGVIGGATLIPAVISGLIEGAKGFSQGGLRGAAAGTFRGAYKPFAALIGAARSTKIIDKLQEGATLTQKEVGTLNNLTKEVAPAAEIYTRALTGDQNALRMVADKVRDRTLAAHGYFEKEFVTGLKSVPSKSVKAVADKLRKDYPNVPDSVINRMESTLDQIAGHKSITSKLEDVANKAIETSREKIIKSFESPENLEKVRVGLLDMARKEGILSGVSKMTAGRATQAATGLALSGVIGGGSAFLQYGKGVETGSAMTAKQREKLTKNSSALAFTGGEAGVVLAHLAKTAGFENQFLAVLARRAAGPSIKQYLSRAEESAKEKWERLGNNPYDDNLSRFS
jgi:hypothetical protein